MAPEVHCGEGDHLMADRGDQTAQTGRVLDLRKADGMYERERNYWIRGQPSATPPPRWSVVRDVLHWVK